MSFRKKAEELAWAGINLERAARQIEDRDAEINELREKLEHLVDARNAWGELNRHDAFMESQKERCRLNTEVASLRAEVAKWKQLCNNENEELTTAYADDCASLERQIEDKEAELVFEEKAHGQTLAERDAAWADLKRLQTENERLVGMTGNLRIENAELRAEVERLRGNCGFSNQHYERIVADLNAEVERLKVAGYQLFAKLHGIIIEGEKCMSNVMEVMDPSGHSKHIWDADSKDEVKAAKELYKSLIAKGYRAFHVKKGGEEGKAMSDFDPEAEKMIMVPPLKGG